MKNKTYTLKPTKKQLKIMKLYWAVLQDEINIFNGKIGKFEKEMSEGTKIDDLEFFLSEYGYYCGIGNADRTMNLIHAHELEK